MRMASGQTQLEFMSSGLSLWFGNGSIYPQSVTAYNYIGQG